MRRVQMKLWAGLAFAMAVVAGCDCNPVVERELFCAFNGPVDGQTLTEADDIDKNVLNGIQINVTVSAKDQADNPVELESATLEIRASSETAFKPGPEATLEAGKATFSSTTLPPRQTVLRFNAKERGTDLSCTRNITVQVDLPPQVLDVRYEGDANGDKKLNRAELPSFPVIAVVTLAAIDDGQTVTISDPFGTYGTGTVQAGEARVPLTNLPQTPEAKYSLTVSTKASDGRTIERKMVPLEIDLIVPTIQITCPAKEILGPADDTDPKPEFQLGACAQVASDVTRVELKLGDGQPVVCEGSCIVSSSAVVTFDVPKSGTLVAVLTAIAFDGAGNSAQATKNLTLDFEPPTIAITAPLASANPQTQFTVDLKADVMGADGQVVRFFYTVPPSTTRAPIGTDAVVTGGKAQAQGSFPANGTYNLYATVTDVAGNAAEDSETGIVVNAPGCDLRFTQPAGNSSYLTASNDADRNTPDLQYFFRVNSTTCPNTPVILYVNGANPMATTTDGSGNAQWYVTLPSGTHNLRADIVRNAITTQVPHVVTVDLSVPAITLPQSGQRLNAALDRQRQTPGAQSTLAYTATIPAGGRVDICSNQTPAPMNATACADGAAGWWTLQQNAPNNQTDFTFPDGAYSIKPVVVVGTSTNVGAPVALQVDTVRPTVTQAVTWVGDANGDRRLNIAELAGQPPRVVVMTSEAVTIVVRDRQSGTAYSAPTSSPSGMATVALDRNITTTEANYDLAIELTDGLSNSNVLVAGAEPVDTHALTTVRVDKAAPSCTFTVPTKSQLGVADDADAAAGYQLRASVSTSSDVGTNGVRIDLTGAATQQATVTPSANVATHDFTVSSTGTLTYNLAATCTDESGNATSASRPSIVVDNEVPSCSIQDPNSSQQYGTFTIATRVNVTGTNIDGLPVEISSSLQAQPLGTLTVASGVAQGNITYPNGTQTVSARVTDLAGNVGSCAMPNVVVNAVGCSLTMTKPVTNGFLNKSDDVVGGAPADVDVTGSSSNCNSGQTVKIYRLSPRTEIGSGTVNGSGNFSIRVQLAEGVYDIEAEIDNGAGVKTSTTATNVTVDITDPTVGSATPTGASLFVVARDPHNPSFASAAYAQDESPGAPGNITVTVNNIGGAVGGDVRVLYGNALVGGPTQITADPQAQVTIPVVLSHNTSGQFTIEVRDRAGNVVKPTDAPMQVDVIAPGAPSVSQMVQDARRATIALAWNQTYDDGSDATSGAHQGYDVRWTYNAIKVAGGGETTAMTEPDYFSSSKSKAEPIVGPNNTVHTLTLPPIATYYIAVRARDEVGNYSTFTAPTALANPGTQSTLTNPTNVTGQLYGRTIAARGSLNNDGVDDLVIAADSATIGTTTNAGIVYVYYGSASLTSQTSCVAPACQAIQSYETVSQRFGFDVSVGNVGDLTNENKPDLVVGAPNYDCVSSAPVCGAGTEGRAFIYFGTSTSAAIDTSTGAFIEIRGNAGSQLGHTAQVIPDIDGDGLAEVALSAQAENSNRGRIYVFRGRSRADWLLARTGTDTSGAQYIPLSSATWTFEGPANTSGGPLASGGNNFGRHAGGFAWIGDVFGPAGSPDGVPDFAIPASKVSLQRLYLFSGAFVAGETTPITTGDAPTPNEAQQTLSMTPIAGTALNGFGFRALGGIDVINGTGVDLLVSYPLGNEVQIFADPTGAGFPTTPSLRIGGANSFGVATAAADFDGDGKVDVAIGETAAADSSAWVFYSRQGSFDLTAGSGFAQSRLLRPGPSNFGTQIVSGDFNGDGKPDLAIADSAVNPGKVTLWHP